MRMDDDLRTTFWSCWPSPTLLMGLGVGATCVLVAPQWVFIVCALALVWLFDVVLRQIERKHQQERRNIARDAGREDARAELQTWSRDAR